MARRRRLAPRRGVAAGRRLHVALVAPSRHGFFLRGSRRVWLGLRARELWPAGGWLAGARCWALDGVVVSSPIAGGRVWLVFVDGRADAWRSSSHLALASDRVWLVFLDCRAGPCVERSSYHLAIASDRVTLVCRWSRRLWAWRSSSHWPIAYWSRVACLC